MREKFLRLIEGRTGKPLLIPKNVEVTRITAAEEGQDNYWVEYIWGQKDGEPTTRSVLAQGPLDEILDALSAEVTLPPGPVTEKLLATEEALKAAREELDETRKALGEARSDLQLYRTLDVEKQWLDVPQMGVPTMWSTVRIPLQEALYHRDSSVARAFVTAQGATAPYFPRPLTLAHTNLKEGGRVPNGQPFSVFGVKIELFGSDEACALLRALGWLKWDLAQTAIDIGHLNCFQWDETQKIGYLRLGLGRPEEVVDPKVHGPVHVAGVPVEQTSRTGPPLRTGRSGIGLLNSAPPVPPMRPAAFFQYGMNGVELPGGTTVAVLVGLSTLGPGHDAPRLSAAAGDTIDVRVSLAGFYRSTIEIG